MAFHRQQSPGAALAPASWPGSSDHKSELPAAAAARGAEIRVFALGAGFGNSATTTTTFTTSTCALPTSLAVPILAGTSQTTLPAPPALLASRAPPSPLDVRGPLAWGWRGSQFEDYNNSK